jgi:hypothetical protein
MFSLAKAAQPVVDALSITASDFLLFWNQQMKKWEHHTTSTNLDVRGLKLFIYQLIKRHHVLFPDHKCPGLAEYIH